MAFLVIATVRPIAFQTVMCRARLDRRAMLLAAVQKAVAKEAHASSLYAIRPTANARIPPIMAMIVTLKMGNKAFVWV